MNICLPYLCRHCLMWWLFLSLLSQQKNYARGQSAAAYFCCHGEKNTSSTWECSTHHACQWRHIMWCNIYIIITQEETCPKLAYAGYMCNTRIIRSLPSTLSLKKGCIASYFSFLFNLTPWKQLLHLPLCIEMFHYTLLWHILIIFDHHETWVPSENKVSSFHYYAITNLCGEWCLCKVYVAHAMVLIIS